MFLKFLLPASVMALGVSAPWLVADWFEGSPAEITSEEISSAIGKLPDHLKDSLEGAGPAMLASKSGTDSRNLVASPFPVASQQERVVQGAMSPAERDKQEAKALSASRATAPTEQGFPASTSLLSQDLNKMGLSLGSPAFIRLFKEERELEIWLQRRDSPSYALYKTYKIKKMSGRPGPKLKNGDEQCPEGFYYLTSSRIRREGQPMIDLGFPNDFDRHHGRSGTALIQVGDKASHGAYGLSDEHMAEVTAIVAASIQQGQRFVRLNAFPFRMSDQRMEQEWRKQPQWIEFWANLKEGYDFFENVNRPPDVEVRGGRYSFRLL